MNTLDTSNFSPRPTLLFVIPEGNLLLLVIPQRSGGICFYFYLSS